MEPELQRSKPDFKSKYNLEYSIFVKKKQFMENLIIQPKDKSELNFFLELAKRLGTKISTIESDADERLFQNMEKNRKTSKINRQDVMNTLHNIIKE